MPCLIKLDVHHTWLCILPCLCLCVYYVACFFRVASLVSFGFVPELWGSIRLRPFFFFVDSFFFLVGSQARWPLPSISLLSLLASCSFYLYVVLPTTCHIMPLKLPCQPLTFSPFLANRRLAMLPLCSAPLIVLLVAGEVEDCSMLEHVYVGISQYLLFN